MIDTEEWTSNGEQVGAGGAGSHEDTSTLQVGYELGPYTIKKILGQGGFGITYLAHDSSLEIDVVLKENMPSMFAYRDPAGRTVCSRSGTSQESDYQWALDRFMQEARLLAKLNHPNIVRVLRVFSALGTAYYVMPYVGGASLDKVLEEYGPVNAEFAESLLCNLLDALNYLHGQTPVILHRDLKPGNVLLLENGTPILIDFGTAREVRGEKSQTQIESPGYTPFEQLQTHGKIGPWSDLYSLGGTMYKMLTGKTPPRSTDRIGDDDYLPLSQMPELEDKFNPVFLASIDKALCMNRRERWQSAAEWATALAENRMETDRSADVTSLPPTPAAVPDNPAPSPKKRAATRAILILVGVLGMVGACLYLFCFGGMSKKKTQNPQQLRPVAAASPNATPSAVPLENAIIQGNVAEVERSLNMGADVNAPFDSGLTPLMCAAQIGREKVVKTLLEHHANVHIHNDAGCAALHLSAYEGSPAIVEMLLNAGAKIEDGEIPPLIFAAASGGLDAVKLLLSRGANVNVSGVKGDTPLICATKANRFDVVALLLDKGADWKRKDAENKTALDYANASGNAELIDLLQHASGEKSAKQSELDEHYYDYHPAF